MVLLCKRSLYFEISIMSSRFYCTACNANFAHNKSRLLHLRNFHPDLAEKIRGRDITCPECKKQVRTMKLLVDHVEVDHAVEGRRSTLSFDNKVEFDAWLKEEEKKHSCRFVVRHSETTNKRLTCHRSGRYTPKVELAKRKRQIKQKGSYKIGGTCTAYVKVKINQEKYMVEYNSVHFGHQNDPGSLPLTKEEKDMIAGKFSQGISVKRILEDAWQGDGNEDGVARIHLTNRKDINNVIRDYGLAGSSFKLHEEDIVSVEAWVEAEKKKEDNCVLFYKPQGVPHEDLRDDDFVLVIQKKVQQKMLLKFGGDRVCIDSTHGTTGYEFNLTTIVVVDEMEEGFPVAFCLSSRINTETMTKFFMSVKENCGTAVACQTFMSDDAPVYKNCWAHIMGPCTSFLLCAWHVDRAWQGRLKSVKCVVKRKEAYKMLKTCMCALDKNEFNSLFISLLSKLANDCDTKDLATYLNQYYAGRVEEWAYCYRTNSGINVNMYLEAFHKELKYDFMDGKKCKRVDKCVQSLLDIVHSKTHNRISKKYRGKSTKKTTAVFQRHHQALSLTDGVKKLSETSWSAVSASNPDKLYVITKSDNHTSCQKECGILCQECKVCRKYLVCNCHDYSIGNNMCKHIHAVMMVGGHQFSLPGTSEAPNTCEEECLEELASRQKPKKSYTELKEQWQRINSLIEKHERDGSVLLNGASQHMDALEKLFQMEEPVSTKWQAQNKSEPANKKIDKQRKFFSVKKKKKLSQSRLKKPTIKEMAVYEDILTKGETLNISSGDITMEHNYC